MDNEATTFWASEFDVKAPVVFKLDLGATERIQELEISWEFPAKAFKVSVSDGGAPQQVFATSSNVLPVSRVAVGRTVNTIIVEMTEARDRCVRRRLRMDGMCRVSLAPSWERFRGMLFTALRVWLPLDCKWPLWWGPVPRPQKARMPATSTS